MNQTRMEERRGWEEERKQERREEESRGERREWKGRVEEWRGEDSEKGEETGREKIDLVESEWSEVRVKGREEERGIE